MEDFFHEMEEIYRLLTGMYKHFTVFFFFLCSFLPHTKEGNNIDIILIIYLFQGYGYIGRTLDGLDYEKTVPQTLFALANTLKNIPCYLVQAE